MKNEISLARRVWAWLFFIAFVLSVALIWIQCSISFDSTKPLGAFRPTYRAMESVTIRESLFDFAFFVKKYTGTWFIFGVCTFYGMMFIALISNNFKWRMFASLGMLVIGLVADGGAEAIQMLTPTRDADWIELGISYIGVAVVVAVFVISFIIDYSVRKNHPREPVPKF